jgi:hypothetical protein
MKSKVRKVIMSVLVVGLLVVNFVSLTYGENSHSGAPGLERFVDNGDGTITDMQTQLVWAQSDSGSTTMNWSPARKFCESFNLGGYSDWRMPTKDELLTLYNGLKEICGSIDVRMAPFTWSGQAYWSSEEAAFITAYAVNFETGKALNPGKIGAKKPPFGYVRAVRMPSAVPGGAQFTGKTYYNKFVGLSFSVPEDWYVATDKEAKEFIPDAARVMDLDDPIAKAVVAHMRGMVLLMVSEKPFSSDVQRANRNIILIAINNREVKNDIVSGADYLAHIARVMRNRRETISVSDIITQSLGGEEFHRTNVSHSAQGITVHTSQLARLHNDYIVILNMSADSDDGLEELVQIADKNINLSSVPQVMDSSPEGQSFRKQTSFNPSGVSGVTSSGGNLLKKIGLMLMILGAFWLIKNLFKRK